MIFKDHIIQKRFEKGENTRGLDYNIFTFHRILSQTKMMRMKRRKRLKLKKQRTTKKLAPLMPPKKMTRKNKNNEEKS